MDKMTEILTIKKKTDLEKGRFQNNVLAKANDVFLDTKKIQEKRKKSFLATKLTKY